MKPGMFSEQSRGGVEPFHSLGLAGDAIETEPEMLRERVLARVQEMGFDIHGLDESIIEQLMGNRLA